MEKESKCECMKCLTYNPGRECDCFECSGYSEPEAQSDVHGTGGQIAAIQGTDSWAMRKDRPEAESKMVFASMTPAPDVEYHMDKTGDDARWTSMFEGPGSDLYWTRRYWKR